jgi:hypothetical protein
MIRGFYGFQQYRSRLNYSFSFSCSYVFSIPVSNSTSTLGSSKRTQPQQPLTTQASGFSVVLNKQKIGSIDERSGYNVRNRIESPLRRYLQDELKYTTKDLKHKIARQTQFFDMKVERFKELAKVVSKVGLSEKVLWQYYGVFKVDDFESLGDKSETIKYLQEMLGEKEMWRPDICDFIRVKKDDYLRKNTVIEKELLVTDDEFIGLAFKNRVGMWLKSENDLRNILRLLKEEYCMREEELRSWFTEGNGLVLGEDIEGWSREEIDI